MRYRIQIVEDKNLAKNYIPQWKMWFLPWQDYSFKDLTNNKTHKIVCQTKEMCLDYFIPHKETLKPVNKRQYPTFHFYCTSLDKKQQTDLSLLAYVYKHIGVQSLAAV